MTETPFLWWPICATVSFCILIAKRHKTQKHDKVAFWCIFTLSPFPQPENVLTFWMHNVCVHAQWKMKRQNVAKVHLSHFCHHNMNRCCGTVCNYGIYLKIPAHGHKSMVTRQTRPEQFCTGKIEKEFYSRIQKSVWNCSNFNCKGSSGEWCLCGSGVSADAIRIKDYSTILVAARQWWQEMISFKAADITFIDK